MVMPTRWSSTRSTYLSLQQRVRLAHLLDARLLRGQPLLVERVHELLQMHMLDQAATARPIIVPPR